MYEDLAKILFSKEDIDEKVRELAKELDRDYSGKRPLMVAVLKGSVMFYSDLLRAMTIPLELDFMAISSYGNQTHSSGEVRIIKDLDGSIEGKHVVIVEDIIDSGRTLSYLKNILSSRRPQSVKICTLLNKPERREAAIEPDYRGFDIKNEFVVGYGLDYAEDYRNLPVIGVLKEEIYKQ